MTAYSRIIRCYEMLLVREQVSTAELRGYLKVKDSRSVRRVIAGLRKAKVPIIATWGLYAMPNNYRKSIKEQL